MKMSPYLFFKYYKGFSSQVYVFFRSLILTFNAVEKHLPKKGVVVDLGCGYGITSLYFALKEPQRTVIGFDKNQSRITKANECLQVPNLSFKCQDFNQDTAVSECDAIVLYDFLHHIPFHIQRHVLSQCKRKLKRKGILLIKEIDRTQKFKLFFTYVLDVIVARELRFCYSSASDLKSKLMNLGFDVEFELIKSFWPYPHFLLKCTH